VTDDQLDLLLEARDSLSAAKLLLASGHPKYAASRAYYAMFYIAQAFLEGEGLTFGKHSAVIAAFGKHFALTKRVPVEFHRFLIEAQELRQLSDYGPRAAVDRDAAIAQIARAEEFLQLAQTEIGPIPQQLPDDREASNTG
jgi:uncharacterized protein (UPF0332 family)